MRDWVRELYKEMLVSDRHKEHLPKTIRCLARLERLPPDETRSFLKGISLKRLREILAREDITEYRKGTVRDWIKTREDAEQGAPADAKRPRR